MGGSAGGVVNEGYYGLKPFDTGKNVIFVAPEGNGNQLPWDQNDYTLFDELFAILNKTFALILQEFSLVDLAMAPCSQMDYHGIIKKI